MQPSLALNYLIALEGIFPSQDGTGGSIDLQHALSRRDRGLCRKLRARAAGRCADGQLLPINQNQALFSLLGTQYGGDGTDDLRAAKSCKIGRSSARAAACAVGTAFGSNSVTVTSADLPTTGYVVSGGQTSTGLTLFIGDTLTVLSGGVASSTVINPGGSGTVSAGGIVRGNLVNGGVQTVLRHREQHLAALGRRRDRLVRRRRRAAPRSSSGTVQAVSSGGLAVSTIVRSGGTLWRIGGRRCRAPRPSAAAATELRSCPAVSPTAPSISNGGIEFVFSGGTTSNPTIASGGTLELGAAPWSAAP